LDNGRVKFRARAITIAPRERAAAVPLWREVVNALPTLNPLGMPATAELDALRAFPGSRERDPDLTPVPNGPQRSGPP